MLVASKERKPPPRALLATFLSCLVNKLKKSVIVAATNAIKLEGKELKGCSGTAVAGGGGSSVAGGGGGSNNSKNRKSASKKKEKDTEVAKQPKMDSLQTDHELFMQAFESKFFLFVFVLIFLFLAWG